MTKIKIQCSCGKIFEKRPNDCLKSKLNRCETCRVNGRNDLLKIFFEENNIEPKVITDKHKKKNYVYSCKNCDNEISRTRTSILDKQKYPLLCKKCTCNIGSKSRLNDPSLIQSFLNRSGSEIAGEYSGAKTKMKIKCRCGKIFNRQWNSVYYYGSTVCLKCSKKESNFESKIKDFLDIHGIEYIENTKDIIGPLELDIYIPSHKMAIECNGVYWHSEGMGKSRNYHINKTKLCDSSNIDLIHIFDLLWDDRSKAYKSILLSKLGLNDKIHARKCQVIVPSRSQERNFLEKFHLQGYIPSSERLALAHEDKIVSIITLKRPRYNKKYDYEILRFCSRSGITVVGGFSRLMHRYKDRNIITYADKCISKGKTYRRYGMKEQKDSKPGYHYFKSGRLFSRNKFQKHKLHKILDSFDPNLTEYKNMKNNGYDRYWDCGNKVFTLGGIGL